MEKVKMITKDLKSLGYFIIVGLFDCDLDNVVFEFIIVLDGLMHVFNV